MGSLSVLFTVLTPAPRTVPGIFSSVAQSCLTLCDCHGLQHARPPCPSPTPGVYPNSCPLSWGCHPTISSFVVPFSCLQSSPGSGSLPVSQFFISGGHSIGASKKEVKPFKKLNDPCETSTQNKPGTLGTSQKLMKSDPITHYVSSIPCV